MYLNLDDLPERGVGATPPAKFRRWTALIPFYNERDYLAETIASLAAQDEPLELLLVDNGSTDDSAAVALAAAHRHGLSVRLLTEHRPGKVAALKAGLAAVRTRFVATCDADTVYPPHYLRAAGRLLEQPGCAAAGAYFIAPTTTNWAKRVEGAKIMGAGATMPRLCHAGGAGQCFETAALRASGGFDPALWNFVLEDHEVFHRLQRHGRMRYAADLWCVPSPRDRLRPSIRWTLVERLLYAAAGLGAGDWFFYRFLALRLSQRRLASEGMREVGRSDETARGRTAAHPVR